MKIFLDTAPIDETCRITCCPVRAEAADVEWMVRDDAARPGLPSPGRDARTTYGDSTRPPPGLLGYSISILYSWGPGRGQ